MWIIKDGQAVWKTRKEVLQDKTKEELIEIVLDLEGILADQDEY